MMLVYPRLGDSVALEELAKIRATAEKRPSDLTQIVAYSHPLASPVASGGSVQTDNGLRELRTAVELGLSTLWSPGSPGPRGAQGRAELDRRLGEILHEHMRVLPADAAHKGVWSFLSVTVFPDLVWARFPDLHEARVLGGARNALRRAWHRHEVLGRLLVESSSPLGEDELVGLFERSALARNRPLVRALADQLQRYDGDVGRSDFARELYKSVSYLTGPLLLDSLSSSQIEEIVRTVTAGDSWPAAAKSDGTVRTDIGWKRSTTELEAHSTSTALNPGDLVMEFHRSMEQLCKRVIKETGYQPRVLLGMLQEQGGVECARRIAGSSKPSEAFTLLWDKKRLDLAVETLVIREEYRGLFSEELVERAFRRLDDFGYNARSAEPH